MATDLERLTVLIEANTRSYERSMLRLQQQTDKAIRGASKSIGGLNTALTRATGAAKTFATAFGAGFLAGGLAQLPGVIRDMVKSVADLGDQADRIGITAERLQELNFQAAQTGSSAEAMASGLEIFGKRLAEARTGSGELYKLLQQNGIALDDIAKMDVNEALRVFVDLLGNATDEADKLKIATIGGGKAATDWALTFAGGTQALLEFQLQARASSQVISNQLVKSAQEIDDEFAQLTGTISTLIKAGLLEFIQTTRNEISALAGVLDDMRTSAQQAASEAGARAGQLIAGGTPQTSDAANARINQAFDVAGIEEARRRLSRTRVPASGAAAGGGGAGGGGHDAAAAAAEREKKAVVELIAELQREQALIGATDVERRISNELRDAGAVATEAQKQQIIALVTQIEAEQTALDDLIDRMDTLRDAAGSALDSFVQSIAAGEGPLAAMKAGLEDVLQTIIKLAEQQLILNLFGASGTSGGGLFGGLAGALFGGAPKVGSLSPAAATTANQSVAVHVTATPSPLLDLRITKIAHAAEERAIARGPLVARNNAQRYSVP